MARPFSFPDPRDRSMNEPTLVVNRAHVIGNYNQENSENKREYVTDIVREWWEKKAKEMSWGKIEFHESQCVLTAYLEIRK